MAPPQPSIARLLEILGTYKLQTFRSRTFESEFCMGGQIPTDNLPYKIFIPVFGFYMPVTCRRGALQLNVRYGSTSDLHLIQTKVPPSKNKSCKIKEKIRETYWQRLKTICARVKGTFKASQRVWWWFEILEFTYKIESDVEPYLTLSCKAPRRGAQDFEQASNRGLWLRHNLGPVMAAKA